MESSTEHVHGNESQQLPLPVLESATHAFDATAELYAKSELEERLRRIDRSIEKARSDD